jgi:hypothetical protein
LGLKEKTGTKFIQSMQEEKHRKIGAKLDDDVSPNAPDILYGRDKIYL